MVSRYGTIAVYIVASQKRGTLYCGVTDNLGARILAHREGRGSKFAAKYGCKRLVWYEIYDMIADAIMREKSIKKWRRQWKINLI
ncbi:GIY-YIG nuclease family protein [Hyphobacterium sp.]|uniref:GIY-YIG nuclease family protein n=1 Tax=Hyphobacterium sp. TaxID=2004662 RepID=UPI003BAD9722